jgi:DNA-binding CsgD family transcriptional regulator
MVVLSAAQGFAGDAEESISAETHTCCAVDLTELTYIPQPSEQLLKDLFGLTSAEARLARTISRGDTLEETAHSLGIKLSTARTQLAAVFAKTGTCRQAQLIALLVRAAHIAQ